MKKLKKLSLIRETLDLLTAAGPEAQSDKSIGEASCQTANSVCLCLEV